MAKPGSKGRKVLDIGIIGELASIASETTLSTIAGRLLSGSDSAAALLSSIKSKTDNLPTDPAKESGKLTSVADIADCDPQNVAEFTSTGSSTAVATLVAGKKYWFWVEEAAPGTEEAVFYSLEGTMDGDTPKIGIQLSSKGGRDWIKPGTNAVVWLKESTTAAKFKIAGLTTDATVGNPPE
jgi:hypothetical protein